VARKPPRKGQMNVRRGITGQPQITMELEHKEFDKFLDKFMRKLTGEKQILALYKIGLDVTRLLIQKTPVDTGRARAGWYFAANRLAAVLGGGSGYRAGSDEEKAGMAQGAIKMNMRGLRKSIEIINAVKYIMMLEYGWSTQAPYGMVRITLQIIRRQMPDIILNELSALWNKAGVGKWSHWRASVSGPSFRGGKRS